MLVTSNKCYVKRKPLIVTNMYKMISARCFSADNLGTLRIQNAFIVGLT